MGHHYMETRGPAPTLADRWFEARQELEEAQEAIDKAVARVAKNYGFVCCGMDEEERETLVVTLEKIPQALPQCEALEAAITEATGFDYVELNAR
jgi:multidrug resistance efflux pump